LPSSSDFQNIKILKISLKNVADTEFLVAFLGSVNSERLEELDLANSIEISLADNAVARKLV
jgi:hypothetical protein